MRTNRRSAPLTTSRQHLAVGAVTAGLLRAVAGCSVVPSWAPGGGSSVQHLADGTAFLVAERSSGDQMTAIVRGTLTTINGGCLGFDPPDGSGTAALVLPHGSHPTGDGTAVEVAGGPTVRVGDAVMGGGGGRDLTGEEDVVASVWPDAPEACRSATALDVIDDVELDEG